MNDENFENFREEIDEVIDEALERAAESIADYEDEGDADLLDFLPFGFCVEPCDGCICRKKVKSFYPLKEVILNRSSFLPYPECANCFNHCDSVESVTKYDSEEIFSAKRISLKNLAKFLRESGVLEGRALEEIERVREMKENFDAPNLKFEKRGGPKKKTSKTSKKGHFSLFKLLAWPLLWPFYRGMKKKGFLDKILGIFYTLLWLAFCLVAVSFWCGVHRLD